MAATNPTDVFDGNALVWAVRNGETSRVSGQLTLESAFFEATNAAWDLAASRQVLSREAGADVVSRLADLRGEMTVLGIDNLGADAVYELAWETGLTAHDAAYLAAARETGTRLVTDNGEVHDHAPDDVSVITTDDL